MQYLKDIFQELEDDLFNIRVEEMEPIDFLSYWKGYTKKEIKSKASVLKAIREIENSDINAISVQIMSMSDPHNFGFKYSDVEDYIESAIDYMGDLYHVEFKSSVMYNPEVRPMRGIESKDRKGYLSAKPRNDDVLLWISVLFIQKNNQVPEL